MAHRVVVCGPKVNDELIACVGAALADHGIDVLLPGSHLEEATTRREESRRHLDRIRHEATTAVLAVNPDRAGEPDYIGPHTFAEIGVAFAYERRTFLLHNMPARFAEELAAWNVECLNGDLTGLVRALADGTGNGENEHGTRCFRDRQGNEIDLMQWSALFEDLAYRVVRDEFLIPSFLQVRTVWEGVDDIVGAMFATGMSENGTDWTTLGQARTEDEALQMHTELVDSLRVLRSAAHRMPLQAPFT